MEEEAFKEPEKEDPSSVSACPSCERRFLLFTKAYNCHGCGKVYCKKCLNWWIYFPGHIDAPRNCCSSCFRDISSIDHSAYFERFGPDDPTAKTVILLHPITLTRKFWNYHASILSQKYRVFTLDLPAHGSRMDERMSTRSAHSAILSLMKEVEIPPRKCVLWGHGMGGYIALTFGGIYPNLCSGIIATDCGAVRDLSSSALWMASQSLQLAVTKNSTLASRPRDELKNNQIEPSMVVESFLRPGTYYHGWDGILETINVSNYSELIRNYSGKMLFMNGSECAQGAQERFVGAAQEATLEIIMGGNPWFIVDERHRQKALQVVDDFLESIDWTQTIGEDGETFFEDVAIDSPRSSAALRSVGNEINRKKQELEEQTSSSSAQNAEDASAADAKQEDAAEPLEASEEVASEAAPEAPAVEEPAEEDKKEEAESSEESPAVEEPQSQVSDASTMSKGLPPAVVVDNPQDLGSEDASDSAPEVPAADSDEQPTSEVEDTTEADKEPSVVMPADYPEPQEASDPDESNVENETTITITEQTDERPDQTAPEEPVDDSANADDASSSVAADTTEEEVAAPQAEDDNTTDNADAPTEETEVVAQEEVEEVPPAVLPDAVSVSPPPEAEEPPVVIVEEEANNQ